MEEMKKVLKEVKEVEEEMEKATKELVKGFKGLIMTGYMFALSLIGLGLGSALALIFKNPFLIYKFLAVFLLGSYITLIVIDKRSQSKKKVQ
jgi:Flp pilus assembly protein protease CpaA